MKTKEFFSKWKEGIMKVNAYEIVKISLFGNSLVVFGILLGLYVMFISRIWWVVIILIGSLILTIISYLGMIQKYIQLKKIFGLSEEKEVYENEEESTRN